MFHLLGTLVLTKFLINGTLVLRMDYIHRDLHDNLIKPLNDYLLGGPPKGFIVTGIVGCGKSTLIEQVLTELKNKSEINVFSFNGDDSVFRQRILEDSKYVYDLVSSKTSDKAIIFVDEIQKCEEVFDSLKIAFDKGKYSFIVSGSNPAFLSTVAKKRLQRRADQLMLLPISLKELFQHQSTKHASTSNIHEKKTTFHFEKILFEYKNYSDIDSLKLTLNDEFEKTIHSYFLTGGLPLTIQSKSLNEKLTEIRLTVERGFELMSVENNAVAEFTRAEMAKLSGQEFAYKNILEKTRLRKRDAINTVIDDLINHGYLVKRKPILLGSNKTSYLSIFSFIDPGIVTYLTGDLEFEKRIGSALEGYVHARLFNLIYNYPLKGDLHYYKPFIIENDERIRYIQGEVDFVFTVGNRIIPLEVKYNFRSASIDTSIINAFIQKHNCPYGVVLYGGVPKIIKESKLIFWPFWLV